MEDPEGFSELPEVAIKMDEALEAMSEAMGKEMGEGADAMMLSELNGYLCGVTLVPEAVPEEEWLREIWDASDEEDMGPFKSQDELAAFATKVRDYHASIVEELANANFEPVFDVNGETQEVMWEFWALGFARALDLRPEAWNVYLESGDEETTEAMMNLMGLVAVADPDAESDEPITNEDMEEIHEAAPDIIPYAVTALYHATERGERPHKLDS